MSESKQEKPWGTVELAKAAHVDDSYIRQLLLDGKIKGAYKIGKTWLIPRDAGRAWLESRRGRWEKF